MSTTPLATHIAARRRASREQVSDGAEPLRRMATPAVPGDDLNPVLIWMDGTSLRMRSTVGARPTTATASALVDALGQPGVDARSLIAADRAAVNALALLASRASDNRPAQAVLRSYAYLARQPWTSVSVCLTDALAAQFWTPAGADPKALRPWASAFGLSAADPDATIDALMGEVTHRSPAAVTLPIQSEWVAHIHHRSMLKSLASRFSSDQVRAYFDVTQAADLWHAVECLDPLYAPTAVLAGDASRLVDLRMERGQVIGAFDGPVRVKAKSWMTVLDEHHARTGSVKLEGFGFDAASGRVLGILKLANPDQQQGRNVRTAVRHGTDIITAGSHARVVCVETPFTMRRSSGGQKAPWAARAATPAAEREARDVPLWLQAVVEAG